ncbi:MAG: ATP-binding protein [Candidatus Micrarchaeia archaeon]
MIEKEELRYLESEYKKKRFAFISVIGKRRTGKTRLIEEFIKNKKDSIYFFVSDLNDTEVRLSLAEKLHQQFQLTFLGTPTWDQIFEAIFREAQKKRILLVFDEFQRFLRINKAVPSIIQKYIDKYHKTSKLYLVVMGSSIGMMYRLFDHSAALYGRRTGQIFLSPLNFIDLKDWFPNIGIEKLIQIYSIFGGTPKYLEEFEKKKSIMTNIIQKVLSKRSILYNEPESLIKTELPDATTYLNIIKLIAQGRTKANEIADMLTIKTTSLAYFLNILEKDLDVIKKEVPVTEKRPEKSKKTLYFLKDNFFRFWFKYIYPNLSELEIGNVQPTARKIKNEQSQFIGRVFEDIGKEVMVELNKKGRLPLKFSKIGRWWHKDKEIDIIALNEERKQILFCECKWQRRVDAKKYTLN